MAGHHPTVSGFLEIENVKGVTGARYDVGSLLGVLREAGSLEERCDSAKGSNIGACGQKFQKFTTGRASVCRLSHDYCAW